MNLNKSTNFWFNVGHVVITFMYIWQGMHYQLGIGIMITYAALIFSVKTAEDLINAFISLYKGKNNVESTTN